MHLLQQNKTQNQKLIVRHSKLREKNTTIIFHSQIGDTKINQRGCKYFLSAGKYWNIPWRKKNRRNIVVLYVASSETLLYAKLLLCLRAVTYLSENGPCFITVSCDKTCYIALP